MFLTVPVLRLRNKQQLYYNYAIRFTKPYSEIFHGIYTNENTMTLQSNKTKEKVSVLA
jgi:hypothetical protein